MSDLDVTISLKDGGYSAQLDRINRGIKQIQGSTKDMSSHGVTDVQAISASLRTMEGGITNSLRAAERFVAQSKMLSGVAQALFPIAGGIAFIGILGKMGAELVKFIKGVNETPKAITSAFQSMSVTTESATDSLTTHTLKAQDELNKLLGKPPVNGPAIALSEAKEAADNLAKSLQADQRGINELMKSHQISIGGAFITGKAGTADAIGSVTSFEDKFADLGYQYQQALRKGNKAVAEDLHKQIGDARISAHNYSRDQVKTRKEGQSKPGALDDSANIAIFEGFDQSITDREDQEAAEKLAKSTDAQVEAAKTKHEYQTKQAAEAAAAIRKQTASTKEAWDEQLSILKAYEGDDLSREASFWADRIAQTNHNGELYTEAVKKYAHTIGLIQIENFKEQAKFAKTSSETSVTDLAVPLEGSGPQELLQRSRISEENAHIANELAASIRDATAAFEEQNVQVALTTGNMSKYQAAAAMANIHAAQFDEKMNGANGLQYQLDNAKASGDPNQLSAATRAVNLAQIQRGTQIQSDSQAIALNTPLGAATDALRQFAQAANDTGTQLRELIGQALNGINSDIVNGKGFKQTGADLAKSVSTMGLQKAEGNILGAFGLGGKPDGSSSKPLYTIDVTPGAGANGGGFGGGILGKLFGGSKSSDSSSSDSSGGGGVMDSLSSIIGGFGGNSDGSDSDSDNSSFGSMLGFANGGDIDPGMGSILVGENGPEIVQPRSAGTVIPNSKIGGLGGGDTHYHVDARGATDPSATAKMVQQAMMQTHKQSVSDSLKAQKETNLRKPPSARS